MDTRADLLCVLHHATAEAQKALVEARDERRKAKTSKRAVHSLTPKAWASILLGLTDRITTGEGKEAATTTNAAGTPTQLPQPPSDKNPRTRLTPLTPPFPDRDQPDVEVKPAGTTIQIKDFLQGYLSQRRLNTAENLTILRALWGVVGARIVKGYAQQRSQRIASNKFKHAMTYGS